MNLAQRIEELADGEDISGVVIGGVVIGLGDNQSEGEAPPESLRGHLLPWEVGRPYLDHDFEAGYGQYGCPPVYAWTESWVIFVADYDGYLSVRRLPRWPRSVHPQFIGGPPPSQTPP